MLQLTDITLQCGNKTLLEHANLTIYHKQKVGIIGKNGVGKTSLFKLLQGKIHEQAGELQLPQGLSFSELAQEAPESQESILTFTLKGHDEFAQLQERLKIAEQTNDAIAQSDIYQRLIDIDGFSTEGDAVKLLLGLGFTQDDLEKPVNAFSGGWRMRLNLARMLIKPADVFLLDEPTNHLDLESIIWLENHLKKLPKTLLIVSHDKSFLDSVSEYIVHMDRQKLQLYKGNYSQFEIKLAMDIANQQAQYRKQENQKEHLQHYIDRFRYKASKAKQAQSRMKMIAKLDVLQPILDQNPFQFKFKSIGNCDNPLITLHKGSVGYDDTPVVSNINFSLQKGHRIGLIGKNGAGKSTFVKLIAGKLGLQSGEMTVANKLAIGYFTQHQIEQLDLADSPIGHLKRLAPRELERDLRQFLGQFQFTGDKVFETLKSFSGGERARLALALLVWQKPQLLLLDEPTNHLDMDMRDALMMALQEFEGSLILISHDRYLMQSLVEELWLVDNGKLQVFEGDIEDYVKSVLA